MQIDRRDFLRNAAMAAATSAAAAASTTAVASAQPRPALGVPIPGGANVTWEKAPCRFCGTGCHVQVGVEDGRVIAIRGDEQAEVNKGLLCVKGYHVGGILYGEDRLTQPLLRKNGELVPVSWDEALGVIADRIQADPAGFAIYGSGQWTIPEGYINQKFIKGGLSNNHIDPNARLCMASAVTGFLATYGVDEPASCYDDLDECDVLIMWGNNMAEMHPVLFSRVVDRKQRGSSVRIIDIGTRRTRTSDFADHYLEFVPQTDMAILNCVAHQLIESGRLNQDFIDKHCAFRVDGEKKTLFGEAMTFDDYKAAVADYTVESVSELSGVSPEDLALLADVFGDPKLRVMSTWCMGVNQHTRGTAVNTQIHALHLLSGHFGRPGDGPSSLTGQPSACGTVREVGTLAHALPGGRLVAKPAHRADTEKYWNLPEGRVNPKPGYHTVKMWQSFCTPKAEEGGDISTIWVQVTNPGQTLPNLNELFYAKDTAGDKFLIVSDVYPTETTRHADLVLPSALWVEKNGVFGNSERRTQQWFKMVDPPGESRDDVWQVLAVAHLLFERGVEGMKDKDGKFLFDIKDEAGESVPAWEWEHFYDTNVDRHLFEEYRQFSRLKHKDLAPYDEYVKERGLRWPVVQGASGQWHETRWRFAEPFDPYVAKGKGIQFYHSTTKDDRAQIWFRPYEAPPEVPDTEYPFWLCTGRVLEHWHSGTMTTRVKELSAAMPEGYVELHRDDAKELDVRSGDQVRVSSRRGVFELPVWIDGRGQPPRGSVFVPFFDENRLVNLVTLEAYCPISKQPDYKKCAVSVEKV